MPYIRFSSSVKLTNEQKQKLKDELWEAITVIPGKTPEVTMIELVTEADIVKGPQGSPAAFCEVRVFTPAPNEAKEKFTCAVTETIKQFGVPAEYFYVNFIELNEWGSGGHYNHY